MIATWILPALATGALLTGAARAADQAAGMLNAPRRWIWSVSLPLSVFLPLVGSSLPGRGATAPLGGADPRAILAGLLGRLEALPITFPGGSSMESALSWGAVDTVLAALWLASSLATLALFLRGSFVMRAARASARPERLHGAEVRVSHGIGPVTIGLLHPAVVVPAWVRSLPDDEARLVIEHEREHARAGDAWLLALGSLCLVLMPWSLPLWWQHRRLRCAVETDCDARVLSRGADVRLYGRVLLRAAGRPAALPGLSPGLGGTPTLLERRILAMTMPRPRHPIARSIGPGAGALVLLLAACELSTPYAPSIEAEAGAGSTAPAGTVLAAEGAPLVFLDGTEIEGLDVDPSRIKSIEVIKGAAALSQYGERAAGGIVRIVTKEP